MINIEKRHDDRQALKGILYKDKHRFKTYSLKEIKYMTDRCWWKFSFIDRKCPRCGKDLFLSKYYPMDLEFSLKEPWDLSITKRWNLCKRCFTDYMNYFINKYNVYFISEDESDE